MRFSETTGPKISVDKVTYMSPCIARSIRNMSVCWGLGQKGLHRLGALAMPLEIEPRTTIFREREPAQSLFVVTEGLVKVFKQLTDGRCQTTGFIYPSDFLGLAYHDRYVYSAEALTATQLLRFGRQKLLALCEELPDFGLRMLHNTFDELASVQDHILLLGRKHALERIATFLMISLQRAESRGEESGRIRLEMSRRDIADYLGVAYETTSREIRKLAQKGIISLPNHNEVIVLDRVALADIAGYDENVESSAKLAAV